ncbi:MAG: hypothetical protein JO113_04155 [Candidatus Eremiobacteraeota bacterium]|nr:hypothetical protein [Candidatus Eremiobacteraeota bacterium]
MTLPPGAPPALVQVAQRYAETSRGVVMFQMHRVFDVHSAFQGRHEDIVMRGVYDDGTTVRVKVYSYTIDGKPAGASDVSSLEYSWDHPKPGDVFAPPYDPRYLDAYQYQPGGPSTINFTSSVRDAGHGRGKFAYDAQDDVVSITYEPNALPPHANSGTISDLRSEVLPGYWAIAQETQEYKGRYGPFAASGTMQITFSDFRRFPDLASAIQAL